MVGAVDAVCEPFESTPAVGRLVNMPVLLVKPVLPVAVVPWLVAVFLSGWVVLSPSLGLLMPAAGTGLRFPLGVSFLMSCFLGTSSLAALAASAFRFVVAVALVRMAWLNCLTLSFPFLVRRVNSLSSLLFSRRSSSIVMREMS